MSNARAFARRQLADAEHVGNRYFVDLFTLKLADLTGDAVEAAHLRAFELEPADESLAVVEEPVCWSGEGFGI